MDEAGQLFSLLNGKEDPKLMDTHVHEAGPLFPHCPASSSLPRPMTKGQHRTSQLEEGQGTEQALCTTSTSNNMPFSFATPLRSTFSILPNETRHGAGEKEAILWLLTAKIYMHTYYMEDQNTSSPRKLNESPTSEEWPVNKQESAKLLTASSNFNLWHEASYVLKPLIHHTAESHAK